SVQKTETLYVEGLKSFRSGVTFAQTATVTDATPNTSSTIIGTGVGTTTFPANFFVPGRTVRVRAYGKYSSGSQEVFILSLGGTARLQINLGTDNTASGDSWSLTFEFTCRTTGSSGTFFG